MKEYRPVEMLVIPVEEKDLLTLSAGGQFADESAGSEIFQWDNAQYD